MSTNQKTLGPAGSSTPGTLDTSGNIDNYMVSLTAGFSYQFDLDGQGANGGTLSMPVLTLQTATNGFVEAGNSVATGDSQITITPTTTAVYNLQATRIIYNCLVGSR